MFKTNESSDHSVNEMEKELEFGSRLRQRKMGSLFLGSKVRKVSSSNHGGSLIVVEMSCKLMIQLLDLFYTATKALGGHEDNIALIYRPMF